MPNSKKTKKKFRLIYLVGQLGPGGLERQLVCLLEAMDRKYYLPGVVVWDFQDNDTYVKRMGELGVDVFALPPGLGPIGKLLAFGRMVKKLDPEVIHSYSFYTNFSAYWGGLLTRAVAVGSLRSDFTTEKKNSGMVLGRLCARWPNIHISNNAMVAKNINKTRSIFVPKKLIVVRNGLDLQKFRFVNLPKFQKARILAVGSLLPVKRWDRLIRAAADLKQNGYDFLVRIVGDGPLRLSLERQVENLGLTEYVMFLGYRDDIPDLLADSHFLTHTSNREGCPNVVAEAMACGRAVVSTDVGDIPFLIDDGKTGFVLGREDQSTLTQRMGMLIEDIELCRHLGEAGRSKAEKEFGSNRLLSETMAVYRAAGWKE